MTTTKLPTALRKIWALDDFQIAAKKHLPLPVYAYYASAAEDRVTLKANRNAFNGYEFVPRYLVDTTKRSQSITLFGDKYAAPFGIAPMGMAAMCCFEGDICMAKTASQQNILSVLSAASFNPLERVAKEGDSTWYQLYQPGDTGRIKAMLARVKKAGFKTLVMTVDVPTAGNPENQARYGFSSPIKPSLSLAWQGIIHPKWLFNTWLKTLLKSGIPRFENFDVEVGPPILSKHLTRNFGIRENLTWQHIQMIRDEWRGNLVIKGLLAPQDAIMAKKYGVDGIIVSNHGGRQLDGAQASLRALPAMVAAAGDMPVMLDGGIRRGSDILKAYALGAKFTFVGRPYLFALAIGGAAGVTHCTQLLKQEVDRNMVMLGINEISQTSLKALVHRIDGS
ncbi:MAG: alpha-hydroxy-acid oxidizing protein [Rhizobiales bacterium]|nr:alpha-hydroxy-acid oxidizing protein [Hyphomicrobiales bacterium]NRB15711.1 alpha-hydroxy-acid oxidizing protein [Hyphomicrobiales bacterium]